MTAKEISELRRRFRADKNNFNNVFGCYVSDKGEIVTEFSESLSLLPEDETEKILALLKKSLSGTLGKNLVDLTFATRQVMGSEEHRLLSDLREKGPEDAEKRRALYEKIAAALKLESEYMILLAFDSYDVPYKTRNDEVLADSSEEVFRYMVCTIVPMKQTRPALGFSVQQQKFRNIGTDFVTAAPELGFVFPAFDNRSTNIYNALYYTRNAADNHPDFVDAIFKTPLLMPAAEQRETFRTVLAESVAEDCSYEVVQAVQDQLSGLIAEHKENHIDEPLRITSRTVQGVLSSVGVPQDKLDAFDREYTEQFGEDTELSPANLVDPKRMELRTSEVTVQVNPERSDLVQTRVIDGIRYVLIRAEEGVEVNGINISIGE